MFCKFFKEKDMSIFDVLGNGGLGSILDTLAGQARSAQNTFNTNITSNGGLGSMLGAGAIGALLGNVAGGNLLKNAALLGAGAVALNFYKKWAEGQKGAGTEALSSGSQNVPQLDRDTMELITRSMVYAAKSDGNIDAEERSVMDNILTNMAPGLNMQSLIRQVEKEPVDPTKIAQGVKYPEQADDIYRLSCSVINIDQFMERTYLDALARALKISDQEKNKIEAEASSLRRQIMARAR